jgi:GAF domain-containing protein
VNDTRAQARSGLRSAAIDELNPELTERRERTLEQAALRRIATLIAEGVQPPDLFAVVAEEVARVVDAPFVSVARYEPDDTVAACASVSPQGVMVEVGSRWPLADAHALRQVRECSAPARLDDYEGLGGELTDTVRRNGIRSTVAVPIVVAGRLWGAIAASDAGRLPEDTEAHLVEFTALLAVAIANTEAREALARLADEQAALRRVATLAARREPTGELFNALVEEVAGLLPVSTAAMGRYDPDGQVTTVAAWSDVEATLPIGRRWAPAGENVTSLVFRTGAAARIDDFSKVSGPLGERARHVGYRSAVGCPIIVDGRVWGVIAAASVAEEPLPPDMEQRLEKFTELVTTAISDSESRDALQRLADEQVALRHVATLVAEGVAPARIFTAVCEEVGRLVGADITAMQIFSDKSTGTVIAAWSKEGPPVPVGMQLAIGPDSIAGQIRETRAPAHRSRSAEEIGETARELGLESTIGAPIILDGQVWGVLMAGTRRSHAWAEEAKTRLAAFTELVATAIANAESRDALSQLAGEQAALRRVATFVASGAKPEEVLPAVAREVAEFFGVPAISMVRLEADGTSIEIGSWGAENPFPTGTRFDPHPGVVELIRQTERPARVDAYSELPGAIAAEMVASGVRSSIGAPIFVDGRTWGAFAALSTSPEPLPQGAENRLASFTELLSTAIANSDARDYVRQLADEQAALRRVATLVAEGAPPDALFRAVADEVASIVGPEAVTLSHHHADGTFTVAAATNSPGFPVGSRWPLDGPSLAATIHETGRVARIDDYAILGGAVAAAMHDSSLRAAAGSPIVVDSKVWGHISVAAKGAEPLPAGTEQRLLKFTELLATAISNAESRDALARLADEQAALRRVATLVARDALSGQVFNAVAMEVGKLLDTDITVVGRYDGDGAATATGSWSSSPGEVPVGTRSAVGGRNVLTLVAETARPARIDGYDGTSGEAAEIARRYGWRSSIAAPIIVEGRLWGVILVATKRPEPFPAAAEERLAAFTDLVATALANAEANDEVRRFGEEQAALGRVATLVAAGATPEQVFKSVVDETSSLLGLELVAFGRFNGDDTTTIVAASTEYPVAPGSTWSLKDPSVIATVARTKRAARIDDYGDLKGETASVARSQGFRSAIGAPLTVEGRLWGAIVAYSTDPEPIPERSEARLGQFTELVATAVANAEARQALERVAAEQATLRRIATLVARGAQPETVFAAVADETAAVLDAIATVMRFEHDPPGAVVLGISTEAGIPVGTRWDLVEGMTSAEVYRTGRSARRGADADYWSSRQGEIAAAARRLGSVSQVSCPIVVEGALWGVIAVTARQELPPDTERRLEKFTELVTTAIANADAKSELAASRRRIVAAADDARRRIERDLHDGIQQRLIALSFRARAMTRRSPDELPSLAAEVAEGLKDLSDELREVSRGIHPTILTEAGLGPALRALARRSNVPVDVEVKLDERLPAPVEAAAYYIASEALTNVAKHAQANVVELLASSDDGVLTLEVRDDGVGGVDAGRGSGILGLTDRAEALGGTISISSPPRGGTTLSVRLPST